MEPSNSIVGIIAACLLLVGCGGGNVYVPPPPPQVTVKPAEQDDVTDYIDFTGRTRAVASVEIRARVRGFLKKLHFTEGQDVKAGQLLFEIDPLEFQAREKAAQASLASAQAAQGLAEATLTRMKQAAETNAVPQIEVITSQAKLDEAKAAVQAADAMLEEARLNLGYTKIYSPITGRISRKLVDVGNLVGQAETTLLATVKQQHPMYVYFTVSERDLLRVIRNRPEAYGNKPISEIPEEKRARVVLQFSDGSVYPEQGIVDYIDNTVDPSTGTITVRAVVPNPNNMLFPGLFVRVRAPQEKENAVLVPEVAVQRDLAGYFVMVVDEKDIVERVNVTVGPKLGARRMIAEGLEPASRVIVNGLQRARPGIQVSLDAGETPPGGGKKDSDKSKPEKSSKKAGGEA